MIDLDLSAYDTTLPARPAARPPAPPAPRPRRARRISDYAGAIGAALDPAAGLALDADRYGWTLKSDGCYAQLSTDATGRISSVLSQAGRPLPEARDLIGIVAAPPFSTLVGELEAHVEAGIAAARARGYACLHLFDILRVDSRYLARAPYLERRAALYAAQSWVETVGREEPAPSRARRHDWTLDARGNAHATVAAAATRAVSRSATTARNRGAVNLRGSAHQAKLGAALLPGRFVSAIPRDIRRLPIIPLVRGTDAARALWSSVEATGAEGLVAVRLDAPIGARRSKLKIKLTDTIDGRVISSDRTAAVVRARIADDGGSTRGVRWRVVEFTVAGYYAPGSIVEVAHNGWHDSGQPRFARVVRERHDKAA